MRRLTWTSSKFPNRFRVATFESSQYSGIFFFSCLVISVDPWICRLHIRRFRPNRASRDPHYFFFFFHVICWRIREKKVPEKWPPGKKSPEKGSPEKWSPKKCPSKIVLRRKNARKFKLFSFYRMIPLHSSSSTRLDAGCKLCSSCRMRHPWSSSVLRQSLPSTFSIASHDVDSP